MFIVKRVVMNGYFTNRLADAIKELLAYVGISIDADGRWSAIISLCAIAIVAFLVSEVLYRIALVLTNRLLKHKEYVFLSKLVKYGAVRKLSHLVPPVIINTVLPAVFDGKALTLRYIENFVWIYFIVMLVIAVNAVLNSVGDSAFTNSKYHDRPIKGFIQITKAIIYIIAVIVGISVLTNKSPLYLIGGLGAFAAVIMLIAKDSIMGFVGGFLLLENDMVRLGDWIEVTGTGINGVVIDISLTIVKVQNFDNTIVTIPPYSLINSTFTNWRGMTDSGGRRIARGYNVKLDNIKPCGKEQLARLRGIDEELDLFITRKLEQSREGKVANTSNPDGLTNGTIDTNMGLFRAYAEMYLRHHPLIRRDMLIMVRTLAPTEAGLPIQFYCFTTTTDWKEYESIQSEIMEHFAAIMPHFGLYPFQTAGARDTIISGLLEGNFPVERIEGMPYKTTL